jgi:hypothetical protein
MACNDQICSWYNRDADLLGAVFIVPIPSGEMRYSLFEEIDAVQDATEREGAINKLRADVKPR